MPDQDIDPVLPARVPGGPVAPSAGPAARLRPLGLGEARIGGGFWADRQRINREVTLPDAVHHLEDAGNFDNLRLAAGQTSGTYRGRVFYDSDVYKWLEALAWEQGREASPELARLDADATALIEAAQADDGYVNSYFQTTGEPRFSDLPFGHELFCAGHLFQAAVAQHRATGRTALLGVARRFADYLATVFGPGRMDGVPGHPEIETALVELYRETRTRDYLDLAGYFIDARGKGLLGPGVYNSTYYQDDVPLREATTVSGHAVRALFLTAGATDVYLETGDQSLLTPLLTQWRNMVASKTHLTGGVGSRWEGEAFGDAYELTPDRAYCETCAAHASVQWSWRLLLATGDAGYADLMERTLYNAFAAGLSQDGRRYFYANPLQLRAGATTPSSRSPARGRQPWFGTACCPPNIMRQLSSLDHYLATRDDDGVQVHLYAPGTVRTRHGGGTVELRVATDYPWDAKIEIEVAGTPAGAWTLSLRVPSWCSDPQLSVNGRSAGGDAPTGATPGGYARLRRQWRRGDRVELVLPMPARRTVPDPRADALRGCVAIERGPLVYCVEQADQSADVAVDDLMIGDAEPSVVSRADLLGGVTTIEAAGSAVTRHDDDGLPYRSPGVQPAGQRRDTTVTAVPYFAWANRGVGPMRVWIPAATPSV